MINSNELLQNGIHIIYVKANNDLSLLNKLKEICIPNLIYLEIENLNKLEKNHPAHGKKCKKNKNTIFICKNQNCSLPITTIEELEKNIIL